jgi:hypothetical protein
MELCSCTSSCCSSDENTDNECDSNSEQNELFCCTCTCEKKNNSKKGKSETVIKVRTTTPRNKVVDKFEREDNIEFKKEFDLAKKLLSEFLKKIECKKPEDDICRTNSTMSIKTTVKNIKSDSELKITISARNLSNKKTKNCSCELTSYDSSKYCTTSQDKKFYEKNKKYKKAVPRDKINKKFLIADDKSENDSYIFSRIKTEMKKIKFEESSSDESNDIDYKKWCKDNKNVNVNLNVKHDRVLTFENSIKSNQCPTHQVYVTEMKKFKNILNCLKLRDNDFKVIPGIGPIYNERLQKRFKNIKQLLETANMMEKEDFKCLLKCYANINCYYSEMIYNSCIEYLKQKNIVF